MQSAHPQLAFCTSCCSPEAAARRFACHSVQLLNIGRQMRSGVHSDSLSVQRRLSHHGQAGQLLVTPSSWLALMLKVSDLVCCSTAHQELMHNAALPAHIRRNSLCSASDLGAEAAHAVRQPASSQAQGGAYWFGDLSCQAVSDSRRGVRRVRCRLPPPTDQRCTVPAAAPESEGGGYCAP